MLNHRRPRLLLALLIAGLTCSQSCFAGETDQSVICARLHSLLCSCCPGDDSIASLTLDLLETNSSFPARPMIGSETDYWTILQRSPGGRQLARRIDQVYRNSLNDHPYLTESQLILLRVATLLSLDPSGHVNSKSQLRRAYLLAGNLCAGNIPAESSNGPTLFVLPFYALAETLFEETSSPKQDIIAHTYNLNDHGLHILYPYQGDLAHPGEFRAMHDRFVSNVKRTAGDSLLGNHSIHLHSLGIACAALTLLDYQGDDTLRWDLLQSAPATDYPKLAQALGRIHILIEAYQRQAEVFAKTAVPPNEDKLNLAIRNAMRLPVDTELKSAKTLIVALFDPTKPEDLPEVLLEDLLLPFHYQSN